SAGRTCVQRVVEPDGAWILGHAEIGMDGRRFAVTERSDGLRPSTMAVDACRVVESPRVVGSSMLVMARAAGNLRISGRSVAVPDAEHHGIAGDAVAVAIEACGVHGGCPGTVDQTTEGHGVTSFALTSEQRMLGRQRSGVEHRGAPR